MNFNLQVYIKSKVIYEISGRLSLESGFLCYELELQMKTTSHIRDFLDAFVDWASDQSDVQAIALVGSYARGEAKDDSDIDLVILTDQPEKYLADIEWTERFGTVEKHQTEDYGKLFSVRVWYQNGPEVEYGITTPDWAAIPLDAGTREVISGGMIVLFERGILLSRHAKL
jgi:predicted nucleotidyltransferase